MSYIAWDDCINKTATTISLSGATEDTNQPASRVASDIVTEPGKWTPSAGTGYELRADFGSAKSIRLVGLVNHNVLDDGAGTIAIKLGTSAGASDVYNGSATAPYATDADSGFFQNHWVDLGADYSARYLTIAVAGDYTVTDATVGRLWASPLIDISVGLNLTTSVEDGGVTFSAIAGQAYKQLRYRKRAIDFEINRIGKSTLSVSEESDLYALQKMAQNVGTTKPVVFMPFPGTAQERFRWTLFGFLQQAMRFSFIENDIFISPNRVLEQR